MLFSTLPLQKNSMRLGLIAVTSALLLATACSPDNVKNDPSLKKIFDDNGVVGCFGLFDNGQGDFTVYNLPRFSDSVYTPASTFKIVNSLIGLETGVISDTTSIIKWDSTDRGRAECNRDMTMSEAFRLSCPPWYQELARRVGEKKMQHFLDTLGYGARYGRFIIKTDLDTFWLNSNAKVTADEELGLVKKLYFSQLPFQKRSQQLVKGMMVTDINAKYTLAYKTGWGSLSNGNQLGWVVGWVEENNHPYFFVLQVESPDRNINMREVRMNVLKGILGQLGFLQGKK